MTTSGRPSAAVVGTSGKSGECSVPNKASAFTFPAWMSGKSTGKSALTGTTILTVSAQAGAATSSARRKPRSGSIA
jgi:hypothetical protein